MESSKQKFYPKKSKIMILKLAYYGDPVLRKKCEPIKEVTDEIRQLVSDMVETMEANNGIGLAAPQVHRSLRLFITRVPTEDEEGKEVQGELLVFINPEIIEVSEEISEMSEGCLSIPKLHGNVGRPYKTIVRAMDLEGNLFTQEFVDLNSHCVLHENDHINGVLFIDRVHGKERKELEPKLRVVKKEFSQGKK